MITNSVFCSGEIIFRFTATEFRIPGLQVNKIISLMWSYPHWSEWALVALDWAWKRQSEATDPARRPILPVDWWPGSPCPGSRKRESPHCLVWECLAHWLDLDIPIAFKILKEKEKTNTIYFQAEAFLTEQPSKKILSWILDWRVVIGYRAHRLTIKVVIPYSPNVCHFPSVYNKELIGEFRSVMIYELIR